MRIITSLLLILSVSVTFAQQLKLTAKTGDAEMDLQLNDINTRAQANPDQFKTNVSATFSVSIGKVNELMVSMAPGDVFMALQMSSSTGKPIDTVVSTYKKNKDKGWGVIAKEMGIKPGSPEFHAMKKAMKENKKKGKGKEKGDEEKGSKGKGKKK